MNGTHNKSNEFDFFGKVFPEYIDEEKNSRAIRAAMRRTLTPIQKQILLLHYADKLSISQIARLRNVRPSTVWRTLKRAKDNMQKVALSLGLFVDN